MDIQYAPTTRNPSALTFLMFMLFMAYHLSNVRTLLGLHEGDRTES